MEEIILQNKEGEILASSREVAERFGKLNKNVNQSIKNLMVENSTVKNMFIETEYKSSRGRMEVEYLMNRDGFSLLVMGFTGKEALEWKLKYIAAFNKMEETIKHSLSEKDSAILKIVHANSEVECACAISNFEKVVTQPLLDTLEENKPLYDFANQVSNTDSLLDLGKVAKMLKEDGIDIGRNKLFEFLRKEKVLMSDNTPYQRFVDNGYFKVKVSTRDNGYGKVWEQCTTFATGKGQLYISKLLKKRYEVAIA